MIKKIINNIRFNYYIALILLYLLLPAQKIFSFFGNQIQMKVWRNGGKVKYDGINICFPKNIGVSYSSLIYWNGVNGFEPNTWKVLKKIILQSNHFLDIGANIGFYSVLAKKIKPSINIGTFEPIPSIYKKNLLFHNANNIDYSNVYQMAISDEDGQSTIYLPIVDSTIEEESTATLRKDSWQSKKPNRIEFQVKTQKLDTFFKSHKVTAPLVIKIDVEDFEYNVLKGAYNTLVTHKPVIVCEILQREHGNQDTYDFLTACEYSIFAITQNGLFGLLKDDFFNPRNFNDFLLIPNSMLLNKKNYLFSENINDYLLLK